MFNRNVPNPLIYKDTHYCTLYLLLSYYQPTVSLGLNTPKVKTMATSFIEPLAIQSVLNIKSGISDWIERLESSVTIQRGVIGETDETKLSGIKKTYLIAQLGPQS